VAGYSYWILHDWRLNPEHPPLSKLAATIPLLFVPLKLHPDPEKWADADEFAMGREFLYRNTWPADDILFRARTVTIVFAVALILMVALWARRCFGDFAGVLAAALASFDPGLLSHGHYVTSDVPLTLFYLGAALAWFCWLRSARWKWLLMTGLLTGLGLATKFSAFLVFPTFVFLWLIRRPSLPWLRTVMFLTVIPFLLVWATYGFDTRPVASDPRIGPTVASTSRLANLPIPAYYFFRGLYLQARHAHGGHTAYLFGRLSRRGFVWYFPVAFLVKTPIGLLASAVAGSLLILFIRPKWLWLAIPAVTYFLISMTTRLNIGIRHILPVYPFIYLLVAAAVAITILTQYGKLMRIGLTFCVLAAVIESMTVYPLSLGFFNFAAGGPRNGTRYLLDSNVDWGQDLKRLRAFLSQHGIQQPCLAYFGGAEPAYYGIRPAPLMVVRSPADLAQVNCVAVVSAQSLFGSLTHPFAALEQRRPDTIVGSSLFVFDLRKNQTKQQVRSGASGLVH